MNLQDRVGQLLGNIHDGAMSSIAYDTSWFVRLTRDGRLTFPSALEWILKHQHCDGSWGGHFETFHDRLISTLAVVNALSKLGQEHAGMVERGLAYIRENARNLFNDSYETIGFELLFPMLLDESRDLGLNIPYSVFQPVLEVRNRKLEMLPKNWVYQSGSPAAHSLEYLGSQVDKQKALSLLDSSGSIANSPSASAYLAQFVESSPLWGYLHSVMENSPDGGAANVRPFEIFEFSWTYYNLLLADIRLPEMERGIRHLQSCFGPAGVGISQVGLMPDADDSALAMKVLLMNDIDVPLDFLDGYKGSEGFLCFPFERNPSVSTNIHIMDALASVPDSPQVVAYRQHIRDFLFDTRVDGAYWKDKWHVSPYYATSHAVLALRQFYPDMVIGSLSWMYETQRDDGSWGVFAGTVEETAYCLQAILLSDNHALENHEHALRKAATYLKQASYQGNYPELWIGKGLYAPINVIDSCVISALALYRRKAGAAG